MLANADSNESQSTHSLPDTGLACIVIIARFYQKALTSDQIAHEFSVNGQRITQDAILLAFKKIGFKAQRVSADLKNLSVIPLPAIAEDVNGGYFILAKFDQGKVLIHDPLSKRPEVISLDVLETRCAGKIILVKSDTASRTEKSRFDFTWFIPAVIKHRKLLSEVLAVSFFLQLLALVTPLFFQVVMDKVLVHHSLTTLDVIVGGLIAVMVFESLLSGIRAYVSSHTASRIDVELGARLFRHMMSLPLAYYQSRRIGDTVARVRELENIRSFLTGSALTIVLDLFFSIVFLGVMFSYSGWLSLIVVLSLPVYVLISLIVTPTLRRRLDDSFSKGAENQAFLVETVSGINTVKSMAIEPHVARRWDDQLASYVKAGFNTQTTSTIANEAVSLVSKLVTALTLWVGAKLVISGSLTVGQLIAFNMLAGKVAQPIMRMAQLWTNFQQTGVSVERLGEILNVKGEATGEGKPPLARIRGSIRFDAVHFRYRPEGPEILRGVNFEVRPGEVIGIVGRSGSGKSTVTKLLQRLYVPESGRVFVDGADISLVDPSSLRRQIGVVLQDNILFNRTIRENIALVDPGAPLDSVIKAAMSAGAHDFISELPEGYDTLVGEQGGSLSGGQRQRIAIARALMGNPRILIFDEATSALDYESESVIQRNMKAICQGRTVIIIAHRLTAVKDADRIFVVDKGIVVEQGPHSELVSNPTGHYARLHRLQHGS